MPAGRVGLIVDVHPEPLGRIAYAAERLEVPSPAIVMLRDAPARTEFLDAESIGCGTRGRRHFRLGRPDYAAGPFVVDVGVVHVRRKLKREPWSGLLDAEDRQSRRAQGVALVGVAPIPTADVDRPGCRIRREQLPSQTLSGLGVRLKL